MIWGARLVDEIGLRASITVDVDNAIRGFAELGSKLGLTDRQLDAIDRSLNKVRTTLNEEGNAARAAAKAAEQLARSNAKVEASIRGVEKAANDQRSKNRSENLSGLIDTGIGEAEKERKKASDTIKERLQAQAQMDALQSRAMRENEAFDKKREASANKAADVRVAAEKRAQAQMDAIHTRALADNKKFDQQRIDSAKRVERERVASLRAEESEMIRQRYALYDVASTYGVIGAAILATAGYAVKVGADFESAFTNVQRTTSGTVAEVGDLRKELVDLSTTIPKTFDEISQIAALGNQLGIEASGIAAFTDTIAKFSAVSGLGVEETAQAFGTISNLLKVSSDEFENLGSAISRVAVTSAATDAQIISVTKEISAGAKQAGLATSEVVGLAGALASLGVAPERARGSLSTYFGTLNKAVAEGGPALDNFSTVTGIAADEIERLVNEGKGIEVFNAFLGGLENTNSVGVTTALEELNLAQLRVADTFTRLQANTGLYTRSLAESAKGYKEAIALDQQFALIVDDLNSQFKILVNSVNALIEELTGGLVPGLAGALGGLSDFVNGLREIAENPAAQQVARLVVIMGTLVGVLFVLKAANALAIASTYALVTAQATLGVSKVGSGLALLIGTLLGVDSSARGAALGLGIFSGVLRAFGRLVLIGFAIELATQLIGVATGSKEAAKWLSGVIGMLIDVGTAAFRAGIELSRFMQILVNPTGADGINKKIEKKLKGLDGFISDSKKNLKGWANGFKDPMADLAASADAVGNAMLGGGDGVYEFGKALDKVGGPGGSAAGAAKEIRTLVDYANDLSSVFSRAFDIRFGSGIALDGVSDQWDTLVKRINEAKMAVAGLTAERGIKQYFLSVAEAYGDTLRANKLRAEIAETNQKIAETQADASTELTGNTKASRGNRAVMTGLVQQYQQYIAALAASGADQETLNGAVEDSRSAFIGQATSLGFSREQIAPYIAALDDMSTVIRNVPRNITVTANMNPALQALGEFAARAGAAGTAAGSAFASGMQEGVAKAGRAAQLQTQIQDLISQMNKTGYSTGLAVKIGTLSGKLASGNYAEGGYTGAGGKYQPAGIVHRGEYVIPKRDVNQRTGLPHADALGKVQRGRRSGPGYASGGFVSGGGVGVTQLSPFDRQLLVDIRNNIGVTIAPQALSGAISASNVNANTRRAS